MADYGYGNEQEYLGDIPCCPACGIPIDYCQGHGATGDPEGYAILGLHDDGEHSLCNVLGCDDAIEAAVDRFLNSFG